MSFDAYRQYLTQTYRSPATGNPLQRDTAGDYVSRLGRLQIALRIDLENATPAALRSLLERLQTDPADLPKKFIGDVGPAIRLYAAFLALSAGTETIPLLRSIEIRPTEAQVTADARLGQDRFRDALERYWNCRCVLTDIARPALLRASHIKPWSVSSDTERRDPFNGLLLAVHLDALFDRALISFGTAGEILVSGALTKHEKSIFGLPPPRQVIPLTPAHQDYMCHHRERFAAGT